MERPVKERLVGAAVLMAAAIILIPEMLSGPDRKEPAEKAPVAGEGAIKTYTIDLNKPPGSSPTQSASSSGGDNRAPPPEELPAPVASSSTASNPVEMPPSEFDQPPPESTPPPAQVSQATPPPRTEAARPTPEPTRAEPPRAEEPARAARTEPPAPQPRAEAPRSTPAHTEPPRQVAAQPARAEAPPKVETPTAKPLASLPPVPTSAGWVVQLGSYSKEATAERLMNEWRAKGKSAFVMPVKSGGSTLYRVRIGPTKDRAIAEAVLRDVKPTVPGAAVVAHP